jgi:23S rRNA maturation-related 3'-5' exoribonuclease YhaM
MSTKSRIIELLEETNREGIENLILHMETNGFFTAPCSGAYHLCKEGGLAEHSLNVCHLMQDLFYKNEGSFNYDVGINANSIIISALLHDLGKADYRNKPNYTPNYLKNGELSTAKPSETNKQRLYIAHEIVSLQIASRFIELTEDEEYSILYHNGLYVSSGRDLNGKERPLQTLLHFADLWCSRFIEKGV